MVKKFKLIKLVLITLFLQSGYICAQETVESYYPLAKQNKSYEDCIENFNINKLNFNKSDLKPHLYLLRGYFQCKATLDNNADVCDKLSYEDYIGICKQYFNEYVEFLGLALTKGVTPKGMQRCKDILGDDSKCRDFLQGLNKNDSSICDKVTGRERDECRAQIEGRHNLCPSSTCEYKAFFVEAVRTNNIDRCNEIKDAMVSSICRAYVVRKEKICQEDEGFKAFKQIYCTQISK